MKKIRSAYRKSPDASARTVTATTGSHCPANGFWLPEGGKGQPVFVFEGSIMPAGESEATVWLLQDASSASPAYPSANPQISRTVSS